MSNHIISTLIKQLSNYQDKTVETLNNGIDEKYRDSIILDYFTKISRDHLFVNSAISKKVADYCQLLNEKENFEEVSLEQIKEIYEALIKIHPLDISFYESLAFYLNNVLDKPEDAKQVLNSGIEIIEERIKLLKSQVNSFK